MQKTTLNAQHTFEIKEITHTCKLLQIVDINAPAITFAIIIVLTFLPTCWCIHESCVKTVKSGFLLANPIVVFFSKICEQLFFTVNEYNFFFLYICIYNCIQNKCKTSLSVIIYETITTCVCFIFPCKTSHFEFQKKLLENPLSNFNLNLCFN